MDSTIGDFLRTRRARLDPFEVGVPESLTRRRVTGLRREEVALLAGVSPDYYVRLEQGRAGAVSDQVLHAVARALRLSDVEIEHLRNLARPPQVSSRRATRGTDPGLRCVVDALHDVPALLLDARMDILAWNSAADAVFRVEGMGPGRNAARHLFRDEATTALYTDWERIAAETVAQLRLVAGRQPDDPALTALIGELSIHSADFRRLWAKGDVREKHTGLVTIAHPVAGPLDFTYEMLTVPSRPDRMIAAYLPEPGSASEERMRLLLSWSTPELRRAPAAGDGLIGGGSADGAPRPAHR